MLKWRLITGISVACFCLAILFLLPAWTHMVLILAIFALAQLEYYEMVTRSNQSRLERCAPSSLTPADLQDRGYHYDLLITTICGILFLLVAAVESPVVISLIGKRFPTWTPIPPGRFDFSGYALVFTPAILLVAGVFRRRTSHAMESFALSYAGFWYIAVLLSFLVRLAFEWPCFEQGGTNYTGRLYILLFALLVKFSDIGGYTFGCLFGKHKLIPEISPKKTVEGLIGGYLFSLGISLIFWALINRFGGTALGQTHFPIVHAIALPLLLTTTGVLGDLAESLIKRSVGVKDSSSRFPGMGGILDIFDSILFSAPFMYIYVITFIK